MTDTCRARQTSDQMTCDVCRLVWDMNDPDPPVCEIDLNPDRDRWKHVATAAIVHAYRAVSLLTGSVIAVGDDHGRVESAAETLVGIGGFEIIGKDGKRV